MGKFMYQFKFKGKQSLYCCFANSDDEFYRNICGRYNCQKEIIEIVEVWGGL